MADFRQKQKMRRVLYSRMTLCVLGICIIIVAYNTWDIYKKERITREVLEKAKEEYSELEKREKFLSEELQQLQTESGVEAEIRGRYGVAKPGEKVIVILKEEKEEEKGTEKTFFGKIKGWFE